MTKRIAGKCNSVISVGLGLLGAVAALPALAAATPSPVGGQIAVSTSALLAIGTAAVATNADGSFTVAWTAADSNRSGNVYFRQFAANGTAKGAEVRVSAGSDSVDYWYAPRIAADASGNFVVVWGGSASGIFGLYGHRYSAAGVSLGNELRLDSDEQSWAVTTQEASSAAGLAMDDAGEFVVAYPANFKANAEFAVVAKRFGADGSPLDAQPIQVTPFEPFTNNGSRKTNDFPAVAMNRSSGSFVVTWVNSNFFLPSPVGGALNYAWGGVMEQRYSATGQAQGAKVFVAKTSFNNVPSSLMMVEQPPVISMDGAGNFVITWDATASKTATSDGVFARRYLASGWASGPASPIASAGVYGASIGLGQEIPAGVGIDPAGNLLVAWEIADSSSQSSGLQAQAVAADGSLQGSAFSIAHTTGLATAPVVSVNPVNGQSTVIWSGWSVDVSGNLTDMGIYAQQFAAP